MAPQQSNLSGDIPVLGPIGIAVTTLGTASQQVIGADPVRRGIIFHNPGSVIFRISPANLAPVSGLGAIPVYPQTEWSLYGDDLTNVNCAWKAVADSSSNNPLTIFNFTDNNPAAAAPEGLSRLNLATPIVSPNGIQIATLGTASIPIIGANPVRRGIIFSNPSAVPIAVCPANLAAVYGAGSMIILPGGEKRIIASGRIRVNCAWNGIAQGGSGNYLTILELL